jgi:hypothetical protein
VAEIAHEFRPRLDTEGFSAVRNIGAQLRDGAVPCDEPAHTHKRCKMCGNVCHARMTSCSSCCLPFVDRGSWEPATMPRPGGDAYSETDSDTNSDDVDSEEEVNEEVTDPAAPAVDAASVMERRRRERRAGAADKSRQTCGPVTSNDNPADDATTQPWWRDWFGDDRLAPPTHPPGAKPRPRTRVQNPGRRSGHRRRAGPGRLSQMRSPRSPRLRGIAEGTRARARRARGDRRRTRGPTARVPPRCVSRCCIHVASTWHQRRRSR